MPSFIDNDNIERYIKDNHLDFPKFKFGDTVYLKDDLIETYEHIVGIPIPEKEYHFFITHKNKPLSIYEKFYFGSKWWSNIKKVDSTNRANIWIMDVLLDDNIKAKNMYKPRRIKEFKEFINKNNPL